MTTITYDETTGEYEVQTSHTKKRHPCREIAAVATHEAGETVVHLVNFDAETWEWMRDTLARLAAMQAQRDAIPARTRRKRPTKAQRMFQEGAR